MRKLTDLMVAKKEGHKYTIVVTWQGIAGAYEEINGGSGERIFSSRSKLTDEPGGARVLIAQAREPLADRNGRPTVMSYHGTRED